MINLLDNRQAIQGLFKIKNKRGRVVPFILNPTQNYYWNKKTRRNLILKPRQKGLTKIIDADQTIDCIKKPTNAVVISHEQESTKRLFAAVKFFVDNLDVKPVTSIDNATTLTFPKAGSSYFIGTAGQRAFGRGDTIDRAHLSEAAFYFDLEKILAGISEAAEYGVIDIETTANGRGTHFYTLWDKARKGLSPYTPIFIPWFFDSEYSIDSLTEAEKAGLSPAVQEMFNTPDAEIIAGLTPEEKDLIARVATEWGIVLTAGQIKWRRYKIWDKGELFFQEYPEDDVSCFLQSGRPVFRFITLKSEFKTDLELIKKGDGALIQYLRGRVLFAGLDGAEGTKDGDNHCFVIMDITEDPGKVIFEIANTEPYEIFDLRVSKIMRMFPNIMLAVEKNGIGGAHCSELRRLGVPFRPWLTTGTTRDVMISELEAAYRKNELIESYAEAKNEALDMFYNDNNSATAPSGKHDDRVFARAIANQRTRAPRPKVS